MKKVLMLVMVLCLGFSGLTGVANAWQMGFEAEAGLFGADWVAGEFTSGPFGPRVDMTASGSLYVGTENGDGDSNGNPPTDQNDGWAVYSFSAPAGTYRIVGRVRRPGSDSFWVRIVDSGGNSVDDSVGNNSNAPDWIRWNSIRGTTGGSWGWDVVHSNDDGDTEAIFVLPADGNYQVQITRREDGTHIDGFVITDDLALDENAMPDYIPIVGRTENPGPADGATSVALTGTVLAWDAQVPVHHPAPIAYNVYLGDTPIVADPNEGDKYLIGTVSADGTFEADLDTLYGALASDTTYYWRVEATAGGDANSAVGSTWSFESVKNKPVITAEPQSVQVGPGGCLATFTVSVISGEFDDQGALTYQWYDDAGALGETSDTLVIAAEGNYYCVVSNGAGDTTSASVSLGIAQHGSGGTGIAITDEAALAGEGFTIDNGVYTITAGGHDIWDSADDFQYVFTEVTGDFDVSVRVLEMDNSNDSGENWGKAGILAREDLTEGSRNVAAILSTGNGTSFQWRDTADAGSGSSRIGSDIERYPYWVRLIREGSLWRGWHAADNNGTPGAWSQMGNDHTLDLPQTLYLGLAVTSHTTGTTHTDKIDNVTFLGTSWKAINPVPDGSVWIDPNVDLTLSWDQAELGPCGAGVTYDVIVGTDPDEVADVNAVPVATVTDLQHVISAAGLNYEDEIYWRVDTNYDDGVTVDSEQGAVWYFEAIKLIPAHVTEPQDVFAYPGDTVEFAFEVTSDTAVTYTWYKEVDGGDVQVGTGNPVILAGVVESDDGYYYCIAENDSGPTQSASARLEVAQLIGHWKLDEIVGSDTIIDSVDTPTHGNHDGTLFGSPGLGAGVSGNPGDMAIGVNIDAELMQYAVIGPVGISGDKPRTITCWAKAAVPVGEIDGWSNIFGFTSVTSGTNKSFDFNRRGGQDQYCIHVYGWERNIATIDDQWHFLAGTYDGTTVSWYNNGEFVGEAVRSGLVTEDLVHLGKRAHSDNLWRGWVDDARVYNYPLDPIAIGVLYTDVTGETVCAKNPIYDFDGDCETTLADFAILAAKWMWCNLVPDCLP